MPCPLCDGACERASVEDLAVAELAWLWAHLAAVADRRGDPHLVSSATTVVVPPDVAARAAAAGLLGRRHLAAGQRVHVDLAALAARIAPLTPGAVAAHAAGRRLAAKAAEAAVRAASEADLRTDTARLVPALAGDDAWAALRRSGWVTRTINAGDPRLLERAATVIARLPGAGEPPVDRRLLAQTAATDPHDLDGGRPTGGLVLAILAATGVIEPGLAARDAWAKVGVNFDDITGGLTMVGVAPDGWSIPDGEPVTVPPRILADCSWPDAEGSTIFVTENPSVLGAAAAIADARIVCTSGTPSRIEVEALARLAAAGGMLAVRADFDDAGLNHVRTILAATTNASPWRMGAADYLAGVASGEPGVPLRVDRVGETPWDPRLRETMLAHGVAVYEESLLDLLLEDICAAADATASAVTSRDGRLQGPGLAREVRGAWRG